MSRPQLVKNEEEQIKNKAKEVVEFLNLGHLSNELAGNLSGGQKKLLELGRTMMVDAKLVLLDEVGAGVKLNKVVFPEPLGPMMPVIEPFFTFKLQFETAVRPPKVLVKPFISKMFSINYLLNLL